MTRLEELEQRLINNILTNSEKEIVRIELLTKNNIKNGFYLYRPIVKIDGINYACLSIKVNKVTVKNDIDLGSLKVTSKIVN